MSKKYSVFRSPEGEALYHAAYEAVLKEWPVPYEELFISTRLGKTHVIASGPNDGAPVLLFNAEFDPVDPPSNATLAKQIWPNSLMITLPGQGHSISDQLTSRCVMQITRNFVQEASVQNLSTDCVQNVHMPALIIYP
jgi:pimeloyl-ACP methyl ester carboxylesterase